MRWGWRILDRSSLFGVLNVPFDLLNGLCLETSRLLPRCLPHRPVRGLLFCLFYNILRSVRFFHISCTSFLWPGIHVVWTNWVLRICCSLLFWILSVFPTSLLYSLFFFYLGIWFSSLPLFQVSRSISRTCIHVMPRWLPLLTCHFF